jgi:hypothetical protein
LVCGRTIEHHCVDDGIDDDTLFIRSRIVAVASS